MSSSGEAGVAESRPVILSVDDDPTVSRAIDRDLRRRYAERYRVLRAESGAQGLDLIGQVKLRGDAVALIISDQRMPELEASRFSSKRST